VERNEIEHFRDLATDYCNLIERIGELDWLHTSHRLRVLIPGLMSAAIAMPDASPTDNEAASTVTHEQWSDRFSAIGCSNESPSRRSGEVLMQPEISNSL